MHENILANRWVEWMNVDLNMIFKKSNSIFGLKSIKESKHGMDKFEG
jgi:hypothetical protein